MRTKEHETGKMNKGFDSVGEIPSKSEKWEEDTSCYVFTAAITVMDKSMKIDQQIT